MVRLDSNAGLSNSKVTSHPHLRGEALGSRHHPYKSYMEQIPAFTAPPPPPCSQMGAAHHLIADGRVPVHHPVQVAIQAGP